MIGRAPGLDEADIPVRFPCCKPRPDGLDRRDHRNMRAYWEVHQLRNDSIAETKRCGRGCGAVRDPVIKRIRSFLAMTSAVPNSGRQFPLEREPSAPEGTRDTQGHALKVLRSVVESGACDRWPPPSPAWIYRP